MQLDKTGNIYKMSWRSLLILLFIFSTAVCHVFVRQPNDSKQFCRGGQRIKTRSIIECSLGCLKLALCPGFCYQEPYGCILSKTFRRIWDSTGPNFQYYWQRPIPNRLIFGRLTTVTTTTAEGRAVLTSPGYPKNQTIALKFGNRRKKRELGTYNGQCKIDGVLAFIKSNLCLQVSAERKYWQNANRYCESIGGHLGSASSKLAECSTQWEELDSVWVTGEECSAFDFETAKVGVVPCESELHVLCQRSQDDANQNPVWRC